MLHESSDQRFPVNVYYFKDLFADIIGTLSPVPVCGWNRAEPDNVIPKASAMAFIVDAAPIVLQ